MDYPKRPDFTTATERAALLRTRGATFCVARVLPTPRIVTIIYSPRLPVTPMIKDRAIKFVRSTAIGITALWISHNYTQPAIDEWRGRDSSHVTEERRPLPAQTTPKPQEQKLVYDHGSGRRCRTLLSISYWFKPNCATNRSRSQRPSGFSADRDGRSALKHP